MVTELMYIIFICIKDNRLNMNLQKYKIDLILNPVFIYTRTYLQNIKCL